MADVLFYLFAILTLTGAVLVVANRNTVNSAVALVSTFIGMAALFVLLGAYFLAVVQVLVYAGAVVVLFVFIVMLIDPQPDARPRVKALGLVAGAVAVALLLIGVVTAWNAAALHGPAPAGPVVGASLKDFGRSLFTTYLLPMQVTGFLLLVAMIGVIVLSQRAGPPPASPAPGAET